MNKVWIILVIIVVIVLAVKFIACKLFTRCALFNDILKEIAPDGFYRYSQGRVYLLVSLLAYFITLGFLTSKILKPNINLDVHSITQIIDALQWVIALMAGYVFGSKGLEVLKVILNKTTPTAIKNPGSSQEQPPAGD